MMSSPTGGRWRLFPGNQNNIGGIEIIIIIIIINSANLDLPFTPRESVDLVFEDDIISRETCCLSSISPLSYPLDLLKPAFQIPMS